MKKLNKTNKMTKNWKMKNTKRTLLIHDYIIIIFNLNFIDLIL
jgi:hypothetical protein